MFGYTMRTNLTVSNLLHSVDIVSRNDLAESGGPFDSLEYWAGVYPRLYFIISEDYGSMVG